MEKTTAIMKNYLKETGLDRPGMEEQPLFRNPRGEKLTRQEIAYILGKRFIIDRIAKLQLL